jgi:hypothetical protein
MSTSTTSPRVASTGSQATAVISHRSGAIVRPAGLPEPVCQHPVLEYRADLCWPAARREILGDPVYVADAIARALRL